MDIPKTILQVSRQLKLICNLITSYWIFLLNASCWQKNRYKRFNQYVKLTSTLPQATSTTTLTHLKFALKLVGELP